MKHLLSVMNKSHNQQIHQNVLEYQLVVDKPFIQFRHQPQLKMMKLKELMQVEVIRNLCYLNVENTYHKLQSLVEQISFQNHQLPLA